MVGDYRDAALMIDLDPDNNVNSITVKKDTADPKSEFDALVEEFTSVYGTPVTLNKGMQYLYRIIAKGGGNHVRV